METPSEFTPADTDSPLHEGRDEVRDTIIPRLIRWRTRREPLVCNIAEALVTEVVFGDLQPGELLNSVDLAKRFEVSRTPVREALALLEQEGLVDIQARRRARVASLNIEQIREIYQLRSQLLAVMVRQLVSKVTDEQLALLGSCVERLQDRCRHGDVDSYFAGHVELQDLMTEYAGNATLKNMIDSLALRVLVLRHLGGSVPGRMKLGLAEQEQILGAIRVRDADLAAAAIAYATRQALLAVEEAFFLKTGALESSA